MVFFLGLEPPVVFLEVRFARGHRGKKLCARSWSPHTADPHTPHTCENISSSLGICENIVVVIARAGGWPVGRFTACKKKHPSNIHPSQKSMVSWCLVWKKRVMQRYGLLPSYHLCLIIGFSPIALWYGIPTYPSLIKHGNGKRPISFTDDFPALNLHL